MDFKSEMQTVIDRIEQHVEAEIAKQNIICPACGYVWDPEDMSHHVSMWGENPTVKDECPNCETPVMVKENVVRTFEVTSVDGGDDPCNTEST